MLCSVLLIIIGLAAGMLVSGGVFTVFVAVGLIPRFATKTKTAHKVKEYESAVIVGTIIGCLVSIIEWQEIIPQNSMVVTNLLFRILIQCGIGIWGLFAGIFVGCLAMSIAEMLNTIPIYARRIRFFNGLRYAVWGIAIGKMTGSFIYFIYKFFDYGG